MNQNTRMGQLRALNAWARNVYKAARLGALTGDEIEPTIKRVAGPRAGALLLGAGIHTGTLLNRLSANEEALLRQLIPFDFTGDPIAFMEGRWLRLECGWPAGLGETMVRLADLGQSKGPSRWTVGKNETGAVVSMSLSDSTPHFLLGGQTGSGKSVCLQSAALQLAGGDNRLVLLDGKMGSSLGVAQHLQGVVGPVAYRDEDIKGALGWAHDRMIERYERMNQGATLDNRLVVLFDEFQEYKSDKLVTGLLSKLAAQGRGAKVHLLAATQHPTVDAFGDSSTRRELTGRLALSVTDASASQVVVGDSLPRADRLLGKGDAYAIAPGAVHRIQCAYVDERDFNDAETVRESGWLVDDWAGCGAGDVVDGPNTPTNQPTNQELAVSLLSAASGEGRPTFLQRCEDAGLNIGSTVGRRLLKKGRAIWELIEESDELREYCRGLE